MGELVLLTWVFFVVHKPSGVCVQVAKHPNHHVHSDTFNWLVAARQAAGQLFASSPPLYCPYMEVWHRADDY